MAARKTRRASRPRARRGRAELWLYLQDECPRLGCGWRGIDVVAIGRKWVRLRAHATGRVQRLERRLFERILNCRRNRAAAARLSAVPREAMP